MFENATIPGLPERLWQAAFFLDMARDEPTREHTDEAGANAERLILQCDEVLAWRKKELGW